MSHNKSFLQMHRPRWDSSAGTTQQSQYSNIVGKLRKRKRVTYNPNRDRLDLFWAEALTPRDCRWVETLVRLSVGASWRTWTRGSRVWSAELGIVFDCLDCKDDYERLVAWGNCMYYVCMSDRQTGISISVCTNQPTSVLYGQTPRYSKSTT